jgi:arginine deiminase
MEGQDNTSIDGSQFDDKIECEDVQLDLTSTISVEQEAYQRPMHLDTLFSEVDSDNNYIC